MITADQLKALACQDCPVAVTVQRGSNRDGSTQLVVVVEHAATCPYAAAHVPLAGGAAIVRLGSTLWHVRADDNSSARGRGEGSRREHAPATTPPAAPPYPPE